MCHTTPKNPDNAAVDYLTNQLNHFRASKDKWAIRAIENKRRYEAAEQENEALKRELSRFGYRYGYMKSPDNSDTTEIH